MHLKQLLIIAITLMHCCVVKAQKSPTEQAAARAKANKGVYEMFDVEKPPTFQGGDKALFEYLHKTIVYPAAADKNSIQGTVVVTFIVREDGSITDATCVKDIGGGCGAEAVRVVGLMPNWNPGQTQGKNVPVRYTLPVRFRLGL
jgi:TonB family protein